eukprot:Platyproteum_vivax@DN8611_c0_g1_i1.p1
MLLQQHQTVEGVCWPEKPQLYDSKPRFEVLQMAQVHNHTPVCAVGCADKCTKQLVQGDKVFPKDFRIQAPDSDHIVNSDEADLCACVPVDWPKLQATTPQGAIKRIREAYTPSAVLVVKFSGCMSAADKPFKPAESVVALSDDGVFLAYNGDDTICNRPCTLWASANSCQLKHFPSPEDGLQFAIVDIDLSNG